MSSTFQGTKQTTEYGCGPAALKTLLDYAGKPCDLDLLTALLRPSPKAGTSHAAIRRVLRYLKIKFSDRYGATLADLRAGCPCLVNYYLPEEDDGHYGVAINANAIGVTLFDPADGSVYQKRLRSFSHWWFSLRYGRRWMLRLK